MKRKRVSAERHSRRCRICRSEDRELIERDYVGWVSASKICRTYEITSRSTLYVHVRALHLDEQRNANIKCALASFIERGLNVKVSASSFVAAIATMSKLSSSGKWVDVVEQSGKLANPLFERMSRAELLRFAAEGTLPEWVTPEERATLS